MDTVITYGHYNPIVTYDNGVMSAFVFVHDALRSLELVGENFVHKMCRLVLYSSE